MRSWATTAFSLVVNGIIVLALCLVTTTGGCKGPKEEEIEPMEFTVVIEENAADVLAEEPNDNVEPEETPEPPKPEPQPEPELPPPPLLPDPDPLPAPVQEQPKEDDAKKKAEEEAKKKAEEAKKKAEAEKKKKEEEAKKKKAEKKPIKIGPRVGPVTQGKKDKTKAATQKALSADEIAKLLAAGAKAGTKNQTPKNEASRCYGAIDAAFRDACDSYGLETSPTGNNPILSVTLGSGGSVKKITVQTSSGDRTFDNQVLQACRQVKRISGLSESFISEYSPVQIRIRVN